MDYSSRRSLIRTMKSKALRHHRQVLSLKTFTLWRERIYISKRVRLKYGQTKGGRDAALKQLALMFWRETAQRARQNEGAMKRSLERVQTRFLSEVYREWREVTRNDAEKVPHAGVQLKAVPDV